MTQIEQLLLEKRGEILQLDFIVRKLYGVLDESSLKECTAFINQILEEGQEEGRWLEMPDAPGCWTIDLKELNETAAKEHEGESSEFYPTPMIGELFGIPPKSIVELVRRFPDQLIEGEHYITNKSRNYFWSKKAIELIPTLHAELTTHPQGESKDPEVEQANLVQESIPEKKYTSAAHIPLREAYQGRLRKDVISEILREYPLKVFLIDDFVSLLYDNLPAATLALARDGLTRILSEGKQKGLWERVPGKLGHYRAKKT